MQIATACQVMPVQIAATQARCTSTNGIADGYTMSLCSSPWGSRGALLRTADRDSSAAVSVPSNGMKEVLQANGSTGGAWQWTAATSAYIPASAYTPALALSSLHT